MRYVDEYRDPERVMALIEVLNTRAPLLSYDAQRPLRIMEVCGGHTHAISSLVSINCCPRILSLFMARAARYAYCRWAVLIAVWKSPAILT
ncbi:hydrogenase expression/formation protein HypD [Atlantibacter hermannii]|nr:hydrogenase expression/formation protein HypD [Atlantibacter hermannii]